MESSRLRALGWRSRIGLREGISEAYRAFLGELVQAVPQAHSWSATGLALTFVTHR